MIFQCFDFPAWVAGHVWNTLPQYFQKPGVIGGSVSVKSRLHVSAFVCEQVMHTFTSLPKNVRYVYIEHGGKDSQFWKGHYGPKMTATSVVVKCSWWHCPVIVAAERCNLLWFILLAGVQPWNRSCLGCTFWLPFLFCSIQPAYYHSLPNGQWFGFMVLENLGFFDV